MLLKADFHIHTREDPHDFIRYTAVELLQEAARQGFQVLALTCHNKRIHSEELRRRAEDLGILLIPGVEAAIEGKHTLLLDMPYSRLRVRNFKHVRALKKDGGLVIAPHPFFPAPKCLNGKLRENLDLFDAIEHSHFYTRTVDFNRKAIAYARRMGIPLVGTSDCHRIWQLGTTYTLIDAEEKTISGVFAAIRANRVRVVTAPLRPLDRIREKWDGVTRPLRQGLRPSSSIPGGTLTVR
ncbi:MAG TPA: PHP-associated domain-containing protein [Vicinamibacteria bacterium]|nr:PHP-associated domain-containing protein [Vicinamibacteria bacterium]